jgi:SAM-dependent methyltransferase
MEQQYRTNMKTYTNCNACGSEHLTPVLDLNPQPLANSFLTAADMSEETYELAVALCNDCCHLQLTMAVDPDLMFRNYLYVSGTSQTHRDYMQWFADFAIEYYAAPGPAKVLDIGCNDGTQLGFFKSLGADTYGIDPATNLYATSSQNHKVTCDYFGADMADEFVEQNGKMNLIVAQNSFAHNHDPLAYLQAIRKVLAVNGLMFISTSQADMVLNNEFDTIYHEHINFFNTNSMHLLCRRAGLNLIDVVKNPIHGTSYIFVISPSVARPGRIRNFIELERDQGLLNPKTYHAWADHVLNMVGGLKQVLQDYRNNGYLLVGYGAAAKGNTLLNFVDERLDVIIDDNPLKQGMYSPGQHIPVVGINYLDNVLPNRAIAFVPLAWNFYTEIKQRIQNKRTNSLDCFVRYFPNVRVET